MSGIIDKLSAIQAFISGLTWKKNLQLTVFLLISGLAYATFENREAIYNFASQTKISTKPPISKKLSKEITDKIDLAVNKSELIIAIQVTIVDFQRNIRYPIYTYTDNADLREIYFRFLDNSITELPLFNTDVNNNRRLVELINGEYICNPFEETIGAKLLPEVGRFISNVCANGIPPYYGKFSGIVSIYVRRPPTTEEIDQIRTLSRVLSVEIYDREFR